MGRAKSRNYWRASVKLIAAVFLIIGAVRLAVALPMFLYALGAIDGPLFAQSLENVTRLLADHNRRALVSFNATGYFALQLIAGAMLFAGAAGVLKSKTWGRSLIAGYLVFHAFTFFNFQVANAKFWTLLVMIFLLGIMIFAQKQSAIVRGQSPRSRG